MIDATASKTEIITGITHLAVSEIPFFSFGFSSLNLIPNGVSRAFENSPWYILLSTRPSDSSRIMVGITTIFLSYSRNMSSLRLLEEIHFKTALSIFDNTILYIKFFIQLKTTIMKQNRNRNEFLEHIGLLPMSGEIKKHRQFVNGVSTSYLSIELNHVLPVDLEAVIQILKSELESVEQDFEETFEGHTVAEFLAKSAEIEARTHAELLAKNAEISAKFQRKGNDQL